jgi:hypothetical protein
MPFILSLFLSHSLKIQTRTVMSLVQIVQSLPCLTSPEVRFGVFRTEFQDRGAISLGVLKSGISSFVSPVLSISFFFFWEHRRIW